METVVQLNSKANLSEHFLLGEFTRSKYPEVYNIPSHEAIANLANLCTWLEVLREKVSQPIIINSGYRSPQLNRKVGGAANSNHLTGCAVDIRTNGMEQAIEYAAILIAYANESAQDYDELLIEKNRYGAIWLHFAVRPKDRSATQGDACLSKNRRKVAFIQA
ncbi:MAG: hypothetical protein J6M36_03470 [Prevotella sp.]|nr:hypothetical protein [Prevotella sp.]